MIDPTIICDDLLVGESPRWHDGRLWVCNWGTGEIRSLDPEPSTGVRASRLEGRVDTTVPFSIDWLPDGRLLVVSGPESLLLVREAGGEFETYADLTAYGVGFNEVVVDGRGNTYVNGGGMNPQTGEFGPGRVLLVRPDGSVTVQADDVLFPNGMAITSDNATLVVADSWRSCLFGFDIAADGSLSGRRVWAELSEAPDGICLDTEGAAWYATVPGDRCVRVREGGEVLQTVTVDRGCFACMLGGPTGRDLYVVAARWLGFEQAFSGPRSGQVLVAPVDVAGAGWPAR